jgi:hypothetical protein
MSSLNTGGIEVRVSLALKVPCWSLKVSDKLCMTKLLR